MNRITTERADGIATLWLDRVDKRNAMDGELMKQLAVSVDALGNDKTVRVIVVRGKGAYFSSGIDHALLMSVMGDMQKTAFMQLHHELQDVFHRMARVPQPVIAALHGACIGMALEMVLAADIRVASEECVLGLPEVAFGLVPDVGGTTRLVRAVGEPRARELILTGRMVKARTAERYGMVHEVVATPDLLQVRVLALAAKLAALPPAALGAAKMLCLASADTGAGTSFRLEGMVQEGLIGQKDLANHFPKALAHIKAAIAEAE